MFLGNDIFAGNMRDERGFCLQFFRKERRCFVNSILFFLVILETIGDLTRINYYLILIYWEIQINIAISEMSL